MNESERAVAVLKFLSGSHNLTVSIAREFGIFDSNGMWEGGNSITVIAETADALRKAPAHHPLYQNKDELATLLVDINPVRNLKSGLTDDALLELIQRIKDADTFLKNITRD